MQRPTLRLWDGYAHTSWQFQDQVSDMQRLLQAKGYPVVSDGFFGPATQENVMAFQSAMGLVADGIVGPRTWAVLTSETDDGQDYFDTRYRRKDERLRLQREAAKPFMEYIQEGAIRAAVPECIIWGIGSRESGWGLYLRPKGPAGSGDFLPRPTPKPWRRGRTPDDGHGFGRGLMQIDYDAHEFARTGDWTDPAANIRYGANVLQDNLRYFRNRDIPSDRVLACAIAAYNCGPRNVLIAVKSGRPIDYFTTGRDYSADVFSRAGWFQRVGWTEI